MGTFCAADALKTESDVEQKLVYPILTREDCLAFDAAEVRTKEYLPPAEIDKGAGKKVGYFPDYGIYLAALPVLVVEAKSPDESADQGFREAQLYAHELNKRIPPGMNPVLYVVASNGHELIFGPWDSDPSLRIPFEELIPTATGFLNFRRLCVRSALMDRALSIRRQLLGLLRYRPLTMLGGHAVQNRELPPNSFASELIPILRRFFGPEAHDNLEVLKRGYVASEQTTRYEKTLESLLHDNLGRIRMPEQVEIKTTRHAAPAFDKGLQTALLERNSGSQILVIGSVGSGKSMFLERYWSFLRGEEITARTKWAVLDFNEAPVEVHESSAGRA
jgi:Type I restriction enzyme R protein N terminus (HSDR_N)